MTTRTQPATVTAYYLARPAALWRTALAPRPAVGAAPRGAVASKSRRPAPQ